MPVLVTGVGVGEVGGCGSGRSGCRCCCKDEVTMMSRDWQVVDSDQRAHFGPPLDIISTCSCSKNEDVNSLQHTSDGLNHSQTTEGIHIERKGAYGSDEDTETERGQLASLTSAVKNDKNETCQQGYCLNGGRCFITPEKKVK